MQQKKTRQGTRSNILSFTSKSCSIPISLDSRHVSDPVVCGMFTGFHFSDTHLLFLFTRFNLCDGINTVFQHANGAAEAIKRSLKTVLQHCVRGFI